MTNETKSNPETDLHINNILVYEKCNGEIYSYIKEDLFLFFLKDLFNKGCSTIRYAGRNEYTHIHYHIMQKQQFYIEDQNLKSKTLNLLKKT